jgi:hypothetical protein
MIKNILYCVLGIHIVCTFNVWTADQSNTPEDGGKNVPESKSINMFSNTEYSRYVNEQSISAEELRIINQQNSLTNRVAIGVANSFGQALGQTLVQLLVQGVSMGFEKLGVGSDPVKKELEVEKQELQKLQNAVARRVLAGADRRQAFQDESEKALAFANRVNAIEAKRRHLESIKTEIKSIEGDTTALFEERAQRDKLQAEFIATNLEFAELCLHDDKEAIKTFRVACAAQEPANEVEATTSDTVHASATTAPQPSAPLVEATA